MHIHWYVKILLKVVLFSSAFSQNSIEWRTIYITLKDSDSQVSCPATSESCYHFQDIFSNASYFFDSYTTLELLPGVYSITEDIGQLVLVDIENFALKGSSSNVTIICQSGATFGLTVLQSQNIEISNIKIGHCSAKLLTDIEETFIILYDLEQTDLYLKYNSSSCDIADSHPACYSFLTSLKNKNVTIYETAILYSEGVGFFSFDSKDLDISKTLLAYNQINCIIGFVSDDTVTKFKMSQSQVKYGQTNYDHQFASGLNLFVMISKCNETHNIYLMDVELINNEGERGNFYMVVNTMGDCCENVYYEDLDVNILITNMSSIQTGIVSPGTIIKFKMYLTGKGKSSDFLLCSRWCTCDYNFGIHNFFHNSLYSPPLGYLFHRPYYNSLLFDPIYDSMEWLSTSQVADRKRVHIVLQNSYFIGSCVTIKDSESNIYLGVWFRFEMNNITISESRCLTALSFSGINGNHDIIDTVLLSDLTIVNSHNNILSVNNVGSYSSKLTLSGNTSILKNQGSISLLNGQIEFKDFVLISDNTAYEYESVLQVSDSSSVYFKGEILFVNNTGRQGGAMSAYSSNVHFEGNVSFIGNSAVNGGAISLKEGAKINVIMDTCINFQANVAKAYGGAIYVEDASYLARNKILKCFVLIDSGDSIDHIDDNDDDYETLNVKDGYCNVEFKNNTAGIAGAALFGGWIDICEPENRITPSNIFNFKDEDSIASNPTRVCMCTNSTPNKYESEIHMEIFPGQTFEIEAVAVGQRFAMIPATVRAETARIHVIDRLQKLQATENHCTKLKYAIRSSNGSEIMLLRIEGQNLPRWINESNHVPDEFLQFRVFITVKDCPVGFKFDNKRNICTCHHYLESIGVQCNFTNYKINRKAQQWIGILKTIIVVHQHCPYDHCHPYAFSLNLSTPDEQCSSSRSGILCGACQPGLSQVLGTSNCKKCSNMWLLFVSVFAFAGILLIGGLIKLNITVSMGTINGLIFYANIVRANNATFFPDKAGNTFLSWFIAWLNLDVGIETCFYDGLDAYIKTWLQFVFPLYIWLLITLIIFSSKFSQRAARLFGVNAVQVLATLFLLSYAKLLRVTITIFQPTQLLDNHKVWHYDGNIAYLGKQHMILMIVAMLFFVIFFIPYTLVLFGIQWLQIFSHYKPFCWVNKLKPLFDAYTGPYKDKHRYWTGLLLLVRIGLFIVFSTNTSGDPAINLLAIIIVIICLFVYLAMFGGVYKNCLLNLLEYSSLLNLIILSVAMHYMMSTNKANHVLSQVSVSIMLCTTVLIIAYHTLVVILKFMKIDPKFNIKTFWKRNKEQPENTNQTQQCNALVNPPVTYSVIELKEPLLEC